MKDRTSKFPGRVKLKPVAGQTDTYDMTRADEPDDTGTPFNTRTMLQDSTGRFLRLPYANPLVDDAFRHMVDRIVPIGTVRTSPVQSLGDAWLKCDGSQVTFAEYPQLFQMLRKTVSSATWEMTTLNTDLELMSNSGVVFFKGKWYVAVSGMVGSTGKNAVLRIYGAEELNGQWALKKTIQTTVQNRDPYPCTLACNEDLLVTAWSADASGASKTFKIYGTGDMESWSSTTFNAVLYGWESVPASKIDIATDGAYWLMVNGANGELYGTTTPLTGTSWTRVTEPTYIENEQYVVSEARLSYINGRFIVSRINGRPGSPGITVYSAQNPSSGWTKMFDAKGKLPGIGTDSAHRGGYISNVCYFSGRYYFAYAAFDGYSWPYYSRPLYLVSFTNDESWERQEIENPTSGTNMRPNDIAASEKMIALVYSTYKSNAYEYKIVTSGEPSAGFSPVTLPGGSPTRITFDNNLAVAAGASAVLYHDYSEDARLLPTISLSDDTTTFIKAKNELDVFEAGG